MEKFVFGRCEAPVVGLAEWSLCLVFGHLGLAVAEVSACASGKKFAFWINRQLVVRLFFVKALGKLCGSLVSCEARVGRLVSGT